MKASESSPIEKMLDDIDYEKLEGQPTSEGLYATHEGILKIGNISIKVLVLNNGKRIIPTEELEKLLPTE